MQPSEVGNLTLYQLKMFTASESELGGTRVVRDVADIDDEDDDDDAPPPPRRKRR